MKEKDDVASDMEIVEKSEVKDRRRTRNDLERIKLAIKGAGFRDLVWLWSVIDVIGFEVGDEIFCWRG